ncbi:hypothetical protein [Halorientalis sp. IM1011]|uniref:hypothetical protein n=1 Tax=Halorientalis sp. IM1011 TaxID=1932360 RepID=UPI0012F85E56|nr:hypothetical protein [Halorientalis sp. IM1011]
MKRSSLLDLTGTLSAEEAERFRDVLDTIDSDAKADIEEIVDSHSVEDTDRSEA